MKGVSFIKCPSRLTTTSLLGSPTTIFNKYKTKRRLLKDLKIAIKENQFSIHFQPKIKAKTEKVASAESLIRWFHPEKGFISPAIFIDLAEQTKVISYIDLWMVEAVIKQLKTWKDSGLPLMRISINVSPDSILRLDLYKRLMQWFRQYNIDPMWVEIEITERTMLDNEVLTLETLKRLKDSGVEIALDDFGVGYSSILYLEKYNIDTIKLDRSFVMNLPHSNKSSIITKSLINLAHDLQVKVVAEGVETQEQVNFLKDKNCDFLQGYFYSKPLTIPQFQREYLGESLLYLKSP